MPIRSAARYDRAPERMASDTLPADLLARIKRKEIGQFGDFSVWTVDGRLIRDEVDTDWVEGGQPLRYGYQPDHEIWIEGPASEHGANALHEFLEARDMASGTDYETAHDKATEAEQAFRSEHPTGDLADAREFLDRWLDEDLSMPKPKRAKPKRQKFTKAQIEQRRAAGRARWAGVSKAEHAAISRKGLAAAALRAAGGDPYAPTSEAGIRGALCDELDTVAGRTSACYAVWPAESLVTSHDPETWKRDPRYPLFVTQERDYEASKKEQEKVKRIAAEPDLDVLFERCPTTASGSPAVTSAGYVLNGNGRAMGLRRMYGTETGSARPARYTKALIERAEEFGLTAEQVESIDRPVLVRVATPLDARQEKGSGVASNDAAPLGAIAAPPTPADSAASSEVTYSHTSKPSENEDEPGMTYDVRATAPDGKVIGTAYFGEYDGALRSGETEVDPAWRRKGIATGMYDHLEKVTGRIVEPSPVLSEDAKAFWDARRKRKGETSPPMVLPKPAPASDFASKTLAVAEGVGPEGRWGADRVYLASLYEALPEPRPDRSIWEQGLLGSVRSGALRLAGGEYVGDMDASLYALSEVHDGPRIVRFLVTPPRSVAAVPSVE